ncbi:MAG: transcription termination/antitermination protein NusA [Pseudomonadota bacterium]|jgi:N utilization substance protein A
MSNKEVLILVDVLAREKNVDKDIVFTALELALASATKKRHHKQFDEDIDVRIEMNKQTGEYISYRRWLVVPNEQGLQSPDKEILLFEAQEDLPEIEVSDYIEEEIESIEFGRIGAQAAKQVILQKIREAEREQVINDFLERGDKIAMGVVKRADRFGLVIESGKVELLLKRENMIPKENIRVGDRVRGYIIKVDREARGPHIEISRTCPEFLMKLFENEVPEIQQGLLQIVSAVRDPGLRAKIAVHSIDKRVDPVGTCVGMRGSRVTAVRSEICNEAIDIVVWAEEPAQYVINSLSPAQVKSILVDEETQTIEVVVDENELAIAIGRNGQNVRLASELTSWKIDILTSEESEQKQQIELEKVYNLFQQHLKIEEDLISLLLNNGFHSLEEIAYVPIDELHGIGLDENTVQTIRSQARESLLTLELVAEENIDNTNIELRNLEGMTTDILSTLAAQNINSLDDLAELSTDELTEYVGISEDEAKALILKAREHWFN